MATKRYIVDGVLQNSLVVAPANMAKVSTAAVTYYVRSDGNDSNDGLASDSAHSLLTIQAAVDKLPEFIANRFVIDIGAGNFAGFYVRNKIVGGFLGQSTSEFPLTITGAAFVNFGSGNSGTCASGSNNNQIVTDTGKSWTPHAFRGKIVTVDTTDYVIRDNDATTIEIVGYDTNLVGKAYQVKDWSTVINATNATCLSGVAPSMVRIDNVQGARAVNVGLFVTKLSIVPPAGLSAGVKSFIVLNSDVTVSYVSTDNTNCVLSGSGGFGFYDCMDARVNNCYISNATYSSSIGIQIQTVAYVSTYSNVLIYNCSTGSNTYNVRRMQSIAYVYADSCVKYGIGFRGGDWMICTSLYVNGTTNGPGVFAQEGMQLTVTGGVINNCKYGMILGSHSSNPDGTTIAPNPNFAGEIQGTIVIQNCTNAGLYVNGGAAVKVSSMTGTNGTFGIVVREGSKVFITSGTAITGASGDISLDGNVLSYATDFSTDLSVAVNQDLGTAVKRIDP